MAKYLKNIEFVRNDSSTPWGFRLEGGTDIGHSLNIQRVIPESVAELSGLREGDYVISINNSDARLMTHDQAKMELIRSCNEFKMVVERNALSEDQVRKNIVIQNINKIASNEEIIPMQATKYKANPVSSRIGKVNYASLNLMKENEFEGSGSDKNSGSLICYQNTPGPGQKFITKTAQGRLQSLGHSSYNSPLGLYSEKNVKETLGKALFTTGADTEANVKPNDLKIYCEACRELIGKFVIRVQNQIPMHPECVKCCICGILLQNVGYFYIKNRLYCEQHSRQTARVK